MLEDEIEAAQSYLNGNARLRSALGIAADAPIAPRPLGEGEHNLNYRFDDPATGVSYVLRVNVVAQPFHDNQIRYEFDALRALEGSGRTPRPLFLDDSAAAPGKGALVMSFCDGAELDFDRLHDGDLRRVARIMADIHSVPAPEGCPLHRPKDAARDLFDECAERFRVYRASAFEDTRLTAWAERFLKATATMLDAAPRPSAARSIVNTEPLPSHFLLPRSEGGTAYPTAIASSASPASPIVPASSHVSSSSVDGGRAGAGWFVDWERPIVGEPAQDVAYFASRTTSFWDSDYLFPADEAEAFVETYWSAVDGRLDRTGFDARFRLYRALTALRSVTWCCRALIRYRGSTGHTTEKTARKLPVYLPDEFMERIAREIFAAASDA